MRKCHLAYWPIWALLLASAGAHPAGNDVSRDEAAHQVQQQTGGRVLAVERHDHDGRAEYRVKVLLNNGDVRMQVVDAHNGHKH